MVPVVPGTAESSSNPPELASTAKERVDGGGRDVVPAKWICSTNARASTPAGVGVSESGGGVGPRFFSDSPLAGWRMEGKSWRGRVRAGL